jgi:hypothetical protein
MKRRILLTLNVVLILALAGAVVRLSYMVMRQEIVISNMQIERSWEAYWHNEIVRSAAFEIDRLKKLCTKG